MERSSTDVQVYQLLDPHCHVLKAAEAMCRPPLLAAFDNRSERRGSGFPSVPGTPEYGERGARMELRE